MNTHDPMLRAGVILCGGHSLRMGTDKTWMPIGDETLLQRTVRIVGQCVDRVVVAARSGQDLPTPPIDTVIVRDTLTNCGPLAGMLTAFETIQHEARCAFVCACDHPLLRAELIRELIHRFECTQTSAAVGRIDTPKPLTDSVNAIDQTLSQTILPALSQPGVLLPIYCDHVQPLLAVYSLKTIPTLRALLETNERRARIFALSCAPRCVNADELRQADPDLDSFVNVNAPDQWEAIRKRCAQDT